MHPHTAACLTQLEKSILQVERLQRHLARLAPKRPPVYWQLDPAILRRVKQLLGMLQNEKNQLLAAQKHNREN